MASRNGPSMRSTTSFALGARRRKVTVRSGWTSGEITGGGVGAGADGEGDAAGACAPTSAARRPSAASPAAISTSTRLLPFNGICSPPLDQALDLFRPRELDVLERGQDRARAGTAVLEDGVAVGRRAASTQSPQALLGLAVGDEGPAFDPVRRAPLVLE